MKFDKTISDAARAAGIKLLTANDVHLCFLDRGGRKRRFQHSSFGWVEADLSPWGWQVTVRRGSGPLLERPVALKAVRGKTLDEAAAAAVDVFPSVVAVIRATMPVADVRSPSRFARWFGLAQAA